MCQIIVIYSNSLHRKLRASILSKHLLTKLAIMESRDFIEFMKVTSVKFVCLHFVDADSMPLQVKDRILAVQFSIDTKKFDSFRKPFVTNKYLTVIQWEELMRTLNRSLCKQLKLCEEEQMETKGEFVIDDSLQVNYLAKSKNESFIDYSKLNFPYDLNWMLLVTVSRHEQNNDKEQVVKSQKTPKKASLSQKSSNGGTTVTLSSELEYDPSPQIREIASRYTPSKTEGPNRRVLGSPEYCPQSTTKSQLTASTYKASRIDRGDVDFENVTKKTEIISKKNKDSNLNRELFGSSDDESPSIAKRKTKRSSKVASYEEEAIWQASQDADEEKVVRPKKRGLLETVVEEPEKRTRAPKKNLMENWLEKGHKTVEKTNSKSNKVKSNINTEGGATSKKQKTTKENKDPDMFDPESMEKMLTFVETAKLRQEQRAERKLELKDYEIKDCTDMTSDDLKK